MVDNISLARSLRARLQAKRFAILFFSLVATFSFHAMEVDQSKVFALQQQTWPLRRQLEELQKKVGCSKTRLPAQKQSEFAWYHDDIKAHLDGVVKKCDLANYDIYKSEPDHTIEKHIHSAQEFLAKATAAFKHFEENVALALPPAKL